MADCLPECWLAMADVAAAAMMSSLRSCMYRRIAAAGDPVS